MAKAPREPFFVNANSGTAAAIAPPAVPSTPRSPAFRQRDQIDRARALLKPSEVQRRRVPNWLRLALLREFGCLRGLNAGADVLNHALDQIGGNVHNWLDHWGATILSNGQKVLVSEPYQVSNKSLEVVAELADRVGCRWWISANSWHFPGRTIRIVFAEKVEDDAQ